MSGAVQDPIERRRVDGGRVISRLQDGGQTLLPLPIELLCREGRPERNIGHQRQRIGKSRDRDVKADGRRVDACSRVQIRAKEVNRVGKLQRRAGAGPLEKHRRGERRHPELARRIVRAAAQDHEIDLSDGDLVRLDEPDRQAIG